MKYYIRTIRMKGTVKHLPPVTYGVGNKGTLGLLVTMIPDINRANQYVKDLEAGTLTELELVKFVHQNHKVNNLRDYGKVAGAGQLLLTLDNNRATKTGRITAKRRQGKPEAFAQAYGTPQPAAAAAAASPDPKTEQFINIAKDLGYEVQDLHEMDDRLKNWIADLVEISAELDATGDIAGVDEDGCSPLQVIKDVHYKRDSKVNVNVDTSGSVPKSDIGQPVTEDTNIVELDEWDVMAGKHRSHKDMQTTKRGYVPDTIDRVEKF